MDKEAGKKRIRSQFFAAEVGIQVAGVALQEGKVAITTLPMP